MEVEMLHPRSMSMPHQGAEVIDKHSMRNRLSMATGAHRQNGYDEFSESNSDEEIPRSRSVKPDAYATRELCRSLMETPSWDGKSLTWKPFLKEWKVFWSFQKNLLGPQHKKWIFIRFLPDKWRTHMKAHITDADWSYHDIVAFLNEQCDILVPDWKKLQVWRNCVPQGNTYLDFTH